ALIAGPGWLQSWYGDALASQAGESSRTAGLPGLAGAAGGSTAAFAVSALAALAAAVLALRHRRHLRADPEVALALGIALSVLLAPHVYAGDTLLLALPVVAVGRRRPWLAIALTVGLGLAHALEVDAPAWLHPQVAALAAVTWCLVALLRAPAA